MFKKLLPLLTFILILSGLLFKAYQMRDVSFYDWDEGIYASVAQEILDNKTIVTTYNDEVWINKPPLAHILVATSFLGFGDDEMGARILMAIISGLTLVFTYFLTKKILQGLARDKLSSLSNLEQQIAYILPGIVTASTPLFIERSAILNTDVMLALAWLGYFLFRNSFPLKLLFISFGTYTKSLLGLYPLLFEILMQKRRKINEKDILKGAVLVVIPLAWHIVNFAKHGKYFIEAHIMDQMVKRLAVPIELHFGGKLYYAELALENFHILTVLIIAGYITLAIRALGIQKKVSVQKLFRNFKSELASEKRIAYLALLAPIPFYGLLFIVQSKISWYFVTLIPFFSLITGYLYVQIPRKSVRLLMVAVAAIFFAYRFIPATFGTPYTTEIPDHISVVTCLSETKPPKIAYLTHHEERKKKNFLEAAHLNTKTSFIYGGLPSLRYYANGPIEIFYDVDDFMSRYDTFDAIMISEYDITIDNRLKGEFRSLLEEDYEHSCASEEWHGYTLVR